MAGDLTALTAWVTAFAGVVHDQREALTDLDSAIGDADHGSNLDRGMSAAVAAIGSAPPDSPSALFKQVGMTLISKIGGASGPLYGTFFLRLATSAGAADVVDGAAFAAGLRAGLEGLTARGKAEQGDKTMLDALGPAVDALDKALAEGQSLAEALAAASAAADAGRDATIPMLARKGRASYLGERSVGHQDPGATSMALLISTAAATLS